MPRYDFQCAKGHVSEHVFGMTMVPATVVCDCGASAQRQFAAPTVQFHGRSSFTDGATRRKRRPNAGDDLHREHDPVAAAIAKSL